MRVELGLAVALTLLSFMHLAHLLRDADGNPDDSTESLPFFAVWMSRDSVLLAPVDTQEAIIGAWRSWYAETGGDSFEYKACASLNEWYF